MNQFLFSISFCILVHGSANAHDFWIEPSNYRPSVGEPVELALRVGDHFIGFPFPRDPYHMVEFSVHDDSGSRPVSGIISKTPAGVFRASAGGAVVVGYRRNRTRVALEATAFESYLNKAGLTKVLQTRTVEGETTKEGREAYSRYAKTVLSCGDRSGPDTIACSASIWKLSQCEILTRLGRTVPSRFASCSMGKLLKVSRLPRFTKTTRSRRTLTRRITPAAFTFQSTDRVLG